VLVIYGARENFHSAAISVKPEDATRLAEAILNLLSQPEKCRKLKEKSQELIKQFSWRAVTQKELNTLKRALDPKNNQRARVMSACSGVLWG